MNALVSWNSASCPARISGGVRAAVDDLHVVDREDRQPVRLGVEVRPRLEVADHHLGLEVLDELEVRGDVLRARPSAPVSTLDHSVLPRRTRFSS